MKQNSKLWSNEEVQILQTAVNNASTKTEGLKKAAQLLRRSFGAVTVRYYATVKENKSSVTKQRQSKPQTKTVNTASVFTGQRFEVKIQKLQINGNKLIIHV